MLHLKKEPPLADARGGELFECSHSDGPAARAAELVGEMIVLEIEPVLLRRIFGRVALELDLLVTAVFAIRDIVPELEEHAVWELESLHFFPPV